MSKSGIAGLAGPATILEVWAAIAPHDTEEGKGDWYDKTYHATEAGARLGASGIGVMGTEGKVEPRLAVKFNGGQLLLVDGPITLADDEQLGTDVRRRALAKLTPVERIALGLE